MIIKTEQLKDACSKILTAVESTTISSITETLELILKDNIFYLNVTNKEYFVQIKIPVEDEESFHATISANLFLKLVSQTTSEVISLQREGNNLIVTGNGKYKFPLIFDGEELLTLPEIVIENITSQFPIKSSILLSIYNYNSKEIAKGGITRPIQRLYYVDEQGCITFTTGACVNDFTLSEPVKLLLNERLVKLFKLFNTNDVMFTLGYDPISEDLISTKVKFENDTVKVVAILSVNDSLLSSVPVSAIRNRAKEEYNYSVLFNKNDLLETVNRLLLFSANKINKFFGKFVFTQDSLTVYDQNENSKEVIFYEKPLTNLEGEYSTTLDLLDLKITLESCSEQYITISFGNSQAIVLMRGHVYNVIPECIIT